MKIDDMALLREYAHCNSEKAFATLVSRHVNLVYGVALRQVRDPHLAEEITQAVFVILARKSKSLNAKTVLSGWLCRTARYASGNALTIQRRRQHREQEAYMQCILDEPEDEAWMRIAPLLDMALASLGEPDHDAIVLRFFEGRNFNEIGTALGASEDAAKKRVTRALEKLRRFFTRRGVTLSAAAIAGAISANSMQAAPVGLAVKISVVAAKGAAMTTSISTMVKGTMKTMTWLKMKLAVTWGSAIVVAGTGTSVLLANHHSTDAGNIPTESQLRQLFDSVTRAAPDKMRIVSLHTEMATPPSKAEIQRVADATRKMEERLQTGIPEPHRTQRIELAVKTRLETMTGKHYEKIQEWKSGPLYREDVADGWESLDQAAQKTNYDVTRINLVNPTNGATSKLEIMYAIKSFRTSDRGSLYTEARAWNGMGVEDQVASAVVAALASGDSIRKKAKDARQPFSLDEEKLQQILSGKASVFKISAAEVEINSEPRIVFELKPLLKSKIFGAAGFLIECVKTNFNRVTRTEMKNSTGKIQLSSTRSEFDQQDFPLEYRVIASGDDGYTTNQFSILEADLAAHFSDDEVFRLEPRKVFGVVVDTGGKPVIKSYPDGITPTRKVDVSDIVAELNSKKPEVDPILWTGKRRN